LKPKIAELKTEASKRISQFIDENFVVLIDGENII